MKTKEEIIKPFLFDAQELGTDDCYDKIKFISEGRALEAMQEYAEAYHQEKMKQLHQTHYDN